MLNKAKKLFGFTLLELLFVIAIIGVMASLGISYMTKRTEDEKIKKAALQIQQLLEAGINYYTDQSQWPSPCSTKDIKSGTCLTQPNEADFFPYIPALEVMLENPWGTDENGYNWQYTKNDRIKGKFQVLTATPSKNIASRTAALLPNASTKNSLITAEVASFTTPPSKPLGMVIVGYGTMKDKLTLNADNPPDDNLKCNGSDFCIKRTIYPISGSTKLAESNDFFLCPPGMKGNILFIPHELHIGLRKLATNTFLSIQTDICEQRTRNLINNPGNYTLCRAAYHLECSKNSKISVLYDYILICK